MHTNTGSNLHNSGSLTFDLLTLGSMHAKVLPWSISVSSPVLIAQTIFLSEHRHTRKYTHTLTVTDSTDTHVLARQHEQ